MKDYYQILGVGRDASDEHIKKAYRRLAVRYHPDKNKSADAELAMAEINEAYDVLSEPEKKSAYDARLQNPLYDLIDVQPSQPKHRDPAYKPNRPRPTYQKKNRTYELMEQYIRYPRIFNWLGIIVALMFFLDVVLPFTTSEEVVEEVYAVRGGRNRHIVYYMARTESEKDIKLYYDEMRGVAAGDVLDLKSSMIFSVPMSFTKKMDPQTEFDLGYVFRFLFFVPLVMLVCSCIGCLFRDKIETAFNTGIVSFILMVITLTLVL